MSSNKNKRVFIFDVLIKFHLPLLIVLVDSIRIIFYLNLGMYKHKLIASTLFFIQKYMIIAMTSWTV